MKKTTFKINNNYMPRMRTIAQAYKAIKESDPNTAFTMRALRRMVDTKEIPTVSIGNKRLINLDLLLKKGQMQRAKKSI